MKLRCTLPKRQKRVFAFNRKIWNRWKKKKEQSAAPVMQQAIPEGTVLGDGHIKYVLARIDTRLLHGQVATTWTKSTNPDRIIVVSDNVAHDELRKNMIIQAAPPGVKAHVVTD